MKICSKCKIEKDESLYYKDKYTKDGLLPFCKACRDKYGIENKEKLAEYRHTSLVHKKSRKKSNKKYAAGHMQERLEKIANKPTQLTQISMLNLRFYCSKIVKLIILKRDSYVCQLCNKNEKLVIHHIIPVKYDRSDENVLNPKNLITLCSSCHLYKAHAGHYTKIPDPVIAEKLTRIAILYESLSPSIFPDYRPKLEGKKFG